MHRRILSLAVELLHHPTQTAAPEHAIASAAPAGSSKSRLHSQRSMSQMACDYNSKLSPSSRLPKAIEADGASDGLSPPKSGFGIPWLVRAQPGIPALCETPLISDRVASCRTHRIHLRSRISSDAP